MQFSGEHRASTPTTTTTKLVPPRARAQGRERDLLPALPPEHAEHAHAANITPLLLEPTAPSRFVCPSAPIHNNHRMNPSLPQAMADPDHVNGQPLHHRHSSDFRSQPPASAMPANGHAPMPVPSVPVPRPNIGNGMRGFDGPRSPPNGKSWYCLWLQSPMSTKLDTMADIFFLSRHVPCAL